MQKLLKNKDCKERVMEWMRFAIGLNQDKAKMFTHTPVCSDGFLLSLADVLLLFCKPFTAKFTEYPKHFEKVNCFYLLSDNYIFNGSKIEKLDSETVTAFVNNCAQNLTFTGVTTEPHPISSIEDSGDTSELVFSGLRIP